LNPQPAGKSQLEESALNVAGARLAGRRPPAEIQISANAADPAVKRKRPRPRSQMTSKGAQAPFFLAMIAKHLLNTIFWLIYWDY
jgi:hypothetical protein